MINVLNTSRYYTGHTDELRFAELPITVTEKDTLLAFILCTNTGLTITAASYPEDWNFVTQLTGITSPGDLSYGTFLCFSHQQTGTTTNPTYWIKDLDTNFHSAYIVMFNGCVKNASHSINSIKSKFNVGTEVGSRGITTTTKNSMIVTAVGTSDNNEISGWSNNKSLTTNQIVQSGMTYFGFTNRIAIAQTNKAINIDTYDISYNSVKNNFVIDIALTADKGTNVVMNLIQGLHYNYTPQF